MSLCGLPNKRLKLAAPLPDEFGQQADVRCARSPFVNIPAWCRSLSAMR